MLMYVRRFYKTLLPLYGSQSGDLIQKNNEICIVKNGVRWLYFTPQLNKTVLKTPLRCFLSNNSVR